MFTGTEVKDHRTFSENTTDDYIHIYGTRVVKMYKYPKAPIYIVGSAEKADLIFTPEAIKSIYLCGSKEGNLRGTNEIDWFDQFRSKYEIGLEADPTHFYLSLSISNDSACSGT